MEEIEIIEIDESINAQIAGGRFKVLIGFDKGRLAAIVPRGSKYRIVDFPVEVDSILGLRARTYWSYCDDGEEYECYGRICWATGESC